MLGHFYYLYSTVSIKEDIDFFLFYYKIIYNHFKSCQERELY